MDKAGLLAHRRIERKRREFLEEIKEKLVSRLAELIEKDGMLSSYLKKVEAGEIDPYYASMQVLGSPQFLQTLLSSLVDKKPGR